MLLCSTFAWIKFWILVFGIFMSHKSQGLKGIAPKMRLSTSQETLITCKFMQSNPKVIRTYHMANIYA